jgi:PhnB protein
MTQHHSQESQQVPPMGLTPILIVENASAAIDFYKSAFGAIEISRIKAPGGDQLMHVRMEVANSPLVLMDYLPTLIPAGSHARVTSELGGTPVTLHLQVTDAKAIWRKAEQAGATVVFPLQEVFWGELYGRLRDPFGHEWTIAQFLRPVEHHEVERSAAEAWTRL